MDQKKWMLYGAYGYTGQLIVEKSMAGSRPPVVAGRNKEKIQDTALRLNLDHRAFDLRNPAKIAEQLEDIQLVLNCAGPFSATAAPMVTACLRTGTHYLDITGEIDVLEYLYARHPEAVTAGVVICPGVGFDVIPTDCVAATLKSMLPDATHLALAFDSKSKISPGTSKTSVEGLKKAGKVRRNGMLQSVPLAYRVREIDFGKNPKMTISVPWGDLSSSYYTTGIPNIETFMSASPTAIKKLQTMRRLGFILGLGVVQFYLKRKITQSVKGPTADERRRTSTRVWGEASNAAGKIIEARLITGNVYDVTVHGALGVVEKLLAEPAPPGAYTPSRLMGKDFAVSLPGSSEMRISERTAESNGN